MRRVLIAVLGGILVTTVALLGRVPFLFGPGMRIAFLISFPRIHPPQPGMDVWFVTAVGTNVLIYSAATYAVLFLASKLKRR